MKVVQSRKDFFLRNSESSQCCSDWKPGTSGPIFSQMSGSHRSRSHSLSTVNCARKHLSYYFDSVSEQLSIDTSAVSRYSSGDYYGILSLRNVVCVSDKLTVCGLLLNKQSVKDISQLLTILPGNLVWIFMVPKWRRTSADFGVLPSCHCDNLHVEI